MLKRLKENWFIIFASLVLVITIILSYNAYVKKEEVFILGYKPYITISGSMEPELEVNSLIVVKKGGYEKIKVGDIISFKKEGFTVNACHRVIEITEKGLITKGDNVEYQDGGYVTKDNFVGKVVLKTNITAQYYRFYQEKGVLVAVVAPLLGIIGIIWGLSLIFSKREEELIEKEIKEEKEIEEPNKILEMKEEVTIDKTKKDDIEERKVSKKKTENNSTSKKVTVKKSVQEKKKTNESKKD